MSKRRYFKRLDDRSGRLERAINIINDGENPNLRVSRQEADPPHPLTRPRAIPPDRVSIVGPGDKDLSITNYVWSVGYSAGTDLLRASVRVVGLPSPVAVFDDDGVEEFA
jgi:hypothetical protein